jgi:mannitol/fructose-specific phosphotransferase system IIA component (Ntr-type)
MNATLDSGASRLGESLTIGQLASYLGWSPRFIDSLVRGERMPGVERDGQIVFRRDEVIDWLQQKIYTLDAAHVTELESHLRSGLAGRAPRGSRSDGLALHLPYEGIALDFEIRSKPEVLRALVNLADKTGLLFDREFLLASLIDREALCSTAVPGGVALCHPRRPIPAAIAHQFVCALRTTAPVDFGAEDGEGTSLFFLLCAPDDSSHLHGLARIARVLHHGGLDEFRNATDAQHFAQAISLVEARLSS